MKNTLIFFLFLLFAIDVFADTNGPKSVSVMEGDSVTLNSGLTAIQSNDVIEWRFSGNRIAKIQSSKSSIDTDEAFGNRLQLNNQTGDLKITNIQTTNTGKYTLKIRRSSGSSDMTFIVNVMPIVPAKLMTAKEGDSVTLLTGLTEIQRDDEILWKSNHQNSPVAKISGKNRNDVKYSDERFRDRLNLDHKNGSLTITNITTTDSGLYEVVISISSSYTIQKSFNVTVRDHVKSVPVIEGYSVTLRTDLTEIQTVDEILWKFGDDDEPIARLNSPVNKPRDNIHLNPQSGDLIISNIQRNQYGDYRVEIITRRMILHRKYGITIGSDRNSGSGLSPGAVTVIVFGVLLAAGIVAD